MLVRYESLTDIDLITDAVEEEGGVISEFELETPVSEEEQSAILWVKLPRSNPSHSNMLSSVAELPCVISVQELIS